MQKFWLILCSTDVNTSSISKWFFFSILPKIFRLTFYSYDDSKLVFPFYFMQIYLYEGLAIKCQLCDKFFCTISLDLQLFLFTAMTNIIIHKTHVLLKWREMVHEEFCYFDLMFVSVAAIKFISTLSVSFSHGLLLDLFLFWCIHVNVYKLLCSNFFFCTIIYAQKADIQCKIKGLDMSLNERRNNSKYM